MRNIALFDLDHTLIPIDSDYEWGQFLTRIGAVDADAFARRNADFFAQYQAGTLDPVEY
ncbi:MAG: HAD family hydrolase, partial [Undibacterium sp.]|nr:HAD family hydrolase [Undibacterium sp.]